MPQKKTNMGFLRLRLVAALLLGAASVDAASPAEWRSRSIYQVLTDRFAAVPTPAQCADFSDYCGGTFAGIQQNLDYIQDLGFDAVWISPVVVNADGGYHGYWAKDLFSVNEHMGSAADLVALSAALHARGMYLMVDIVANHMHAGDITGNVPFNQAADYHDCSNCPAGCNVEDYTNLVQMEHCRLAALMDLDNSDPAGPVAAALLGWIRDLVANYSIDGLRVDTLPYVHPAFWREFVTAAGGLHAIGEVDNGDVAFVAPWQGPTGANAALPGVLSYPLFGTLRAVFAQKQSAKALGAAWVAARDAYADMSLLGVFTDNHDNPRFMHETQDVGTYRAAVAYSLLSDGIPIVYYGSEWLYAGGNDPGCREPLWSPGISYNASASPLGALLAALNAHRKGEALFEHAQTEAWADDQVYAFTKGNSTLAVFTNVGSAGAPQSRDIPAAALPAAWPVGTTVCNALDCAAPCLTVDAAGLHVSVRGGDGAAVFGPRACK